MEKLLSAGALTQMLDGLMPANPVVQIIGYKPMGPDTVAFGSTSEGLRYRLMVSDGLRAHQYCIVSNQDLVHEIKTGKLEKYSVVKVTSYRTVDSEGPADQKRRLIYILNLELIKTGPEVGRKLTAQAAQQADTTTFVEPENLPKPSMPQQKAFNNGTTQPQPYGGSLGANRMDQIRSSPKPMRSSHENQTIGIGELTPYIGKWVVKGRVTSKSGIREYNNAKGGGKLFNFSLADKTGEIKITAFNTDCERVFPYVEPNKVYLLGRASVKNADKRYTTVDFEITLNSDSLLEEVTDNASDVPLAKFNFVSIMSLGDLPPNQPVDLIGAVLTVSDVSTIMSRTKNKELKKRNITIVDKSRHSISVTLWGEQSESFTGAVGDVFVTKAARIGTYGGRSASAGDCIFVNPDIPEARSMKNWYANLIDQNFTSLTNSQEIGGGGSGDQWKTLAQLLDLEQTRVISSSGNQSALYAKCKATLMSVGKNPLYKCCPTEGCGKKLVDTQNGELKCEKCQQTFTSFKYRYKTDIEIEDQTTNTWVTLWDEKAEKVLGLKPDELERFMKMDNKDEYDKIINRPNFSTFMFTLRARIDNYNQEERVKLGVMNIVPLDQVVYGKRLMEEIKLLA